ncbi:hypothetical protein [Endozoicomonas sp.]|uniref:hypothetical protein n=1 Tax=Endozoicomonas sp. TaxID=1892382 RepID=UPI0028853825|nr:hypothetical protein [Endozoicomonas sp.]
MPKMLDDKAAADLRERLEDVDQNEESYNRYCQLQGESLLPLVSFKLVSEHHELKMVRNPDEGIEVQIYLLDHDRKAVLYYNHIEKVDFSIKQHTDQPVRQVMIWRENRINGGNDTHGLVESVFFDFLIGQYSIAVSDSEQTRDGRRMWEKLISMAIEKGMEAGRMDKDNYEYHSIPDIRELTKTSKWLWGDQDVHKNRLAVIMKL